MGEGAKPKKAASITLEAGKDIDPSKISSEQSYLIKRAASRLADAEQKAKDEAAAKQAAAEAYAQSSEGRKARLEKAGAK